MAGKRSVAPMKSLRRLELLRGFEHRDLDAAVIALGTAAIPDRLRLARLKKRKLRLRDGSVVRGSAGSRRYCLNKTDARRPVFMVIARRIPARAWHPSVHGGSTSDMMTITAPGAARGRSKICSRSDGALADEAHAAFAAQRDLGDIRRDGLMQIAGVRLAQNHDTMMHFIAWLLHRRAMMAGDPGAGPHAARRGSVDR